MKQCWITNIKRKNSKKSPFNFISMWVVFVQHPWVLLWDEGFYMGAITVELNCLAERHKHSCPRIPPICRGEACAKYKKVLMLLFICQGERVKSEHFTCVHCKDTIPEIQNKYSQKWNCAASFLIPTFMYLWANDIFPRSVHLFCCRPIVEIYQALTDTWMWTLETRPFSFISRNT